MISYALKYIKIKGKKKHDPSLWWKSTWIYFGLVITKVHWLSSLVILYSGDCNAWIVFFTCQLILFIGFFLLKLQVLPQNADEIRLIVEKEQLWNNDAIGSPKRKWLLFFIQKTHKNDRLWQDNHKSLPSLQLYIFPKKKKEEVSIVRSLWVMLNVEAKELKQSKL